MPDRFITAGGDGILSAVVIEISNDSGKATAIQRLQISQP